MDGTPFPTNDLERLALTVPYSKETANRRFPAINYRQRASIRRTARGKRKQASSKRSNAQWPNKSH